ncbi:MAG TPA: hypothetical protein VFF16_00345 [Telluria sp.]|nr:hypothetical protein [Telluria sp.]
MKTLATDPILVRAYLAALAGVPASAPPVRTRAARLRAQALRRLATRRFPPPRE